MYFSFSLLGTLRNKTKTVSQSKQLRVRLQLLINTSFSAVFSAAYKESKYLDLSLCLYQSLFCQLTVGWHDYCKGQKIKGSGREKARPEFVWECFQCAAPPCGCYWYCIGHVWTIICTIWYSLLLALRYYVCQSRGKKFKIVWPEISIFFCFIIRWHWLLAHYYVWETHLSHFQWIFDIVDLFLKILST